MTSLLSLYLFAQWEIDILGPFFLSFSQRTFIIVEVDYFTKYVKAAPLATITDQKMINFYSVQVWHS